MRLFGKKLKIINIGVRIFHDTLKEQKVDVVHVDWKPPARRDAELLRILEEVL